MKRRSIVYAYRGEIKIRTVLSDTLKIPLSAAYKVVIKIAADESDNRKEVRLVSQKWGETDH